MRAAMSTTAYQKALEKNKDRLFTLVEFVKEYENIHYTKADAALEKAEFEEACRRADLYGDCLLELTHSEDVPLTDFQVTLADFKECME